MNQGAFLTRGLEKVRAEFSLTALAYNMTRVLKVVGIERLLLCRAHGKTSLFFHELSASFTLHKIVVYIFGLIEFSHGLGRFRNTLNLWPKRCTRTRLGVTEVV